MKMVTVVTIGNGGNGLALIVNLSDIRGKIKEIQRVNNSSAPLPSLPNVTFWNCCFGFAQYVGDALLY